MTIISTGSNDIEMAIISTGSNDIANAGEISDSVASVRAELAKKDKIDTRINIGTAGSLNLTRVKLFDMGAKVNGKRVDDKTDFYADDFKSKLTFDPDKFLQGLAPLSKDDKEQYLIVFKDNLPADFDQVNLAENGSVTVHLSGSEKYRFVAPNGKVSIIRTDLKLRDVKIIPTGTAGDEGALVWGLTKYGTLEVSAFDADGNLDLAASKSMFSFFNGKSADFIAIETDKQGRAFAVDKQGYVHVYASNDNTSAMYKSAEPLFSLGELGDFKYGKLDIDSQGVLKFTAIKDGKASGSTLSTNINNLISTESLDLVSGKVSVSATSHYLLKTGILYQKTADGDWKPTEHSDLLSLKRNADGSAFALSGNDGVLHLKQDGSKVYHDFQLSQTHLVDAQVVSGTTYAIDANGVLHFKGVENGTISDFTVGGKTLKGKLTSLVVKESSVFAATSEGQLFKFSLPKSVGANKADGKFVNGVSGVEAILISPEQDVVTLNKKVGGEFHYQKLDTTTGLVTPIANAEMRGFNSAASFGDYGIVVNEKGQRFTLYDGRVMSFDHLSNQWRATTTTNARKLKLGADGKLYALIDGDGKNSFIAQLNEQGFIASTGVKVSQGEDRTQNVAKAIDLASYVSDFTVSASGSVYFTDGEGKYKKLDVTGDDYGEVTLASESDKSPITVDTSDFTKSNLPDGVKQLNIESTVEDGSGTRWLQDKDGRVFYQTAESIQLQGEAINKNKTLPNNGWVSVGKIEKANGFGLLKNGKVFVKTSDSKQYVLDEPRWLQVKNTSDSSSFSPLSGDIKSIAVGKDGALWSLSVKGEIYKKLSTENSQWEPVQPPKTHANDNLQSLKTLANGEVVAKTVSGRLYQSSQAGSWKQVQQDNNVRDFDALFDQLSFSRYQHEYQVLFFGSSQKLKTLFGHQIKTANLANNLRQDIPANGDTNNPLKKFKDWSVAHFGTDSTQASVGHHDDINKAIAEVLAASETLSTTAVTKKELDAISDNATDAYKSLKSTIDAESIKTLSQIRRLIGVDLDNGLPNSDWKKTNTYKQMNSIFSQRKVFSKDNALFQVMEFRQSAFSGIDPVAISINAMLNQGVYLPVVDGDASALVGKLIYDNGLLADAVKAAKSANGSPSDITKLPEEIKALETKQKEAAITKVQKGNFHSLDNASRFFKTMDYLLGGLKNQRSKLGRAITRQGAEKGSVSERYVQLINSMKEGEALVLDAGWKLSADLGAGWGAAQGIKVNQPFDFGFGGVSGKVSAGGGHKYKLKIKKTADGVDIEIGFDRAVEVSPSVTGSVGSGLAVGDVVQFTAGATGTLAYKFTATSTNTTTLSLKNDDKGTIQSTLEKLLSGTLDPYDVLESAKKGAATKQKNTTQTLDFTGNTGVALTVGTSTGFDDEFRQAKAGASLNLASIDLKANLFKSKSETKLKYEDGLSMSKEVTNKQGFLNSLGIKFTPFNASGSVALHDLDANKVDATSRGTVSRPAPGFGYSVGKDWSRLENNFLPKDGYNLKINDKGVQSVTWSIEVQKTSQLFYQEKVVQLLEQSPNLKEKLNELASFTTTENRNNIKSRLENLSGKITDSELSEMKQLSDFVNHSDKEAFRKSLDKLIKKYPQLKGETDAIKANLGSSLWRKIQQPIAIALELSPVGIAKLKSYTSSDGDYTEFVNRIAQDADNFRISSFSVTERRAYSTAGGINALLINFNSDASLSLEKKTAQIDVAYADKPIVEDLNIKLRQLARLDRSNISDSDVVKSIDKKVNAVVQTINDRFGHVKGSVRTDAINAVKALVNQSIDTTDISDAINKLTELSKAEDASAPSRKPQITTSGERLNHDPADFNNRLREFGGVVRSGGESLLSALTDPTAGYKLGQTVSDVQNTARENLISSFESGLNIRGKVDSWLRSDPGFNNEAKNTNLKQTIFDAFDADGQGNVGLNNTQFQQLRNQIQGAASENTLAEFDSLYTDYTKKLNELTTSDIWTLYTDADFDMMELHNGRLFYSVKNADGSVSKLVEVPQDVLTRIVQQEGVSVLDTIAQGRNGPLFLKPDTLDQKAKETLAKQTEVELTNGRIVAAEFDGTSVTSSNYKGHDIVGMLEAIRDRSLSVNNLNSAQAYVLSKFFPSQSGNDFSVYDTLSIANNETKLADFKQTLNIVSRSDVLVDTVGTDKTTDLIGKYSIWKSNIDTAVDGTNKIVTRILYAKGNVSFKSSKQALYFGSGSDGANSRAKGLGVSYLFMLSKGNENRFLEAVETNKLVSDANFNNAAVSDLELSQSTDFRLLVDKVNADSVSNAFTHQAINQSLDDAFKRLSDAGADKYLVLETGNHVIQLAKKTAANGQASYFFYDSNLGTLQANKIAELKDAVDSVLSQRVNQEGQQLRDVYNLGDDGFTVKEFDPQKAGKMSAFKDVAQLINGDQYQTEASRLKALGDVNIDGLSVSADSLYKAGVSIDGKRVSKQLLADFKADDITRIKFDRKQFETFFASDASDQQKQNIAKIVKKRLQTVTRSDDVFLIGKAGFTANGQKTEYGDLAKTLVENIDLTVTNNNVIKSRFNDTLKDTVTAHKQLQISRDLQTRLGLTESDADALSKLTQFSQQFSDISMQDFVELRLKSSGVSTVELLTKEASARVNDDKQLNISDNADPKTWNSADARHYLQDKGVLSYGSSDPVDVQQVNHILTTGSKQDKDNLKDALIRLETTQGDNIFGFLMKKDNPSSVRSLGTSLDHQRKKLVHSQNAAKVANVGGKAFKAYGYFDSIRGLVDFARRMLNGEIKDKDKADAIEGAAVTSAGLVVDIAEPLIEKGLTKLFTKIGNKLIISTAKSVTNLTTKAVANVAKAAGAGAQIVTGVIGAGFDIYSAVKSFQAASKEGITNADKTYHHSSAGLAIAGAVTGVGLTIAAVAALIAGASAATGPFAIVGLAIAGVLLLGGFINEAVHKMNSVEERLTREITIAERWAAGWAAFTNSGTSYKKLVNEADEEQRQKDITAQNIKIRKAYQDNVDKHNANSHEKFYEEFKNGITQIYTSGKATLGEEEYDYYLVSREDHSLFKESISKDEDYDKVKYERKQGYIKNILINISDVNDQQTLTAEGWVKGRYTRKIESPTHATSKAQGEGHALYSLGGGDDTFRATEEIENTFVVGGGKKYFAGLNKADQFIWTGSENTNKDTRFIGNGGMDSFIVRHNAIIGGGYEIDLSKGTAKYKDKTDIFANLEGIERVVGHHLSDDTLTGDEQNNTLDGAGGKDLLKGNGGSDILLLRAGTTAEGGTGEDIYVVHDSEKDSDIVIIEVNPDEVDTIKLKFDFAAIKDIKLTGSDIILTLMNKGGTETRVKLKDTYDTVTFKLNRFNILTEDNMVLSMGVVEGKLSIIADYKSPVGKSVKRSLAGNVFTIQENGSSDTKTFVLKDFVKANMATINENYIFQGTDNNEKIDIHGGNEIIDSKNGSDTIYIDQDASGIKYIVTTSVDKTTDVISLPFASTEATYSRHGNSLLIQGYVDPLVPSSLVTINLMDYYLGEQYQYIELYYRKSNETISASDLLNKSGAEIIGVDADSRLDAITEGDDIIQIRTAKTTHINALDGHDIILDYDESIYDAPEELRGGAGNDDITSGIGSDSLFGEAGNDILRGGQGEDRLYGGTGNDELFGGAGYDELFGDEGDDQLTDFSSDSSSGWQNKLSGGAGNDLIKGAGLLIGGSGSDHLIGSSFDDLLVADEDDDAANDSNILDAGSGNDTLIGGKGTDLLIGGAGDDTYIHDINGGHDEVRDTQGSDTIHIAGDDISASQIRYQRSGDNLAILLFQKGIAAGSKPVSSLSISGYFASDTNKIENFSFSQKTGISKDTVDKLKSAMAGLQEGQYVSGELVNGKAQVIQSVLVKSAI